MKITFSVKQVIAVLVIIAIVFASFYVGGIRYRHEIDRLNTAIYMGQDTIRKQLITINGLRVTVFKTDVLLTESTSEIKKIVQEKEYYKKLHFKNITYINSLEAEITILKKQGWYKDTIIGIDTEPYVDDALIIENHTNPVVGFKDTIQHASYKDEWAWANVILKPHAPEFSFGVSKLPLQIVLGDQRNGFFMRNLVVNTIATPNPYVNISKQNVIVVDARKKRNILSKMTFFGAGVVITFLLLR